MVRAFIAVLDQATAINTLLSRGAEIGRVNDMPGQVLIPIEYQNVLGPIVNAAKVIMETNRGRNIAGFTNLPEAMAARIEQFRINQY